MKRIVLVTLTILALSVFNFGCAKAQNNFNNAKNKAQDSSHAQVSPKQPTTGQKPTQSPAEVDAQAEKVQQQIDQLLSELEKDSDEQNINSESK